VLCESLCRREGSRLDFAPMSATSAAAESAGAAGPSDRNATRLHRLATILAIVAVAEALGIVLLSALGDGLFQIGTNLAAFGFLGSVVLFPVVGALIVQRRPVSVVAWLMIAIGLGYGFGLLMFAYGATGMPPAPPHAWAPEMLVISQVFFVPVPAVAVAVLLLVFPSDRLLSPRWAPVVILAVVGTALYGIGMLLKPGPIDRELFPRVDNPFGTTPEWAPLVDLMALAGNTMVVSAIALAALSLVVRYRRADILESAQIRWIALVAGIAAVLFPIAALQQGPVSDLAFGLGLISLACLPIAIGIAITRYHLYDIDRLINRALVYGSLSAILAGIFTAGIGLAQRTFVALTGESSDAAIVLTTLVVATLYAPLRKRLEAVVDRLFKYEERRFGAYRDEVRRILAVLEPTRAAERLATEAVAELAATGGAVVGPNDRPVASAGEWPVAAVVRLPIAGGAGGLQAVLVGPRLDGQPHDPRSVAELQEVASLVGTALRLREAPG